MHSIHFSWLKINGEAIYSSIPWKFQNDTVMPGVWYTTVQPSKDSKRQNIYAIVTEYPYTETGVNLFSMAGVLDDKSTVSIIGHNKPLNFYESRESVYVTFPNKRELDHAGLAFAWTLKFDIPV